MYQRDFTDLSFFLHRLSVYSDLCGPEIFLVRKNGTACAGHSEENHHFPGRLHLRDLSAPYADQRIFFRPVECISGRLAREPYVVGSAGLRISVCGGIRTDIGAQKSAGTPPAAVTNIF